MQFHFNTSLNQLADYLRYSAIAGGMPEQFIATVEQIYDIGDLEAEVEKLGDKLSEAEKAKDDLLSELEDLVLALETHGPEEDSREVRKALEWANKVIERHSK